jgi:hypothetical protein
MECQLGCAKSCITTCNDTSKQGQSACASAYRDKQTECQQLSSLAKKTSCLATAVTQKAICAEQTYTNELLCESDCACSLISGPNGSGWAGMDAMFSIKFCKAPVEQKSFQMGTVVTSLQ